MAGYSGKALGEKLGIKAGMKSVVYRAPKGYKLKGAAENGADLDFLQVFVSSEKELTEAVEVGKKKIKKDGMLWISWPKKSSPLFAGITEDHVRKNALKNGLVDVKVCAIDDDWSALKLVYRVKDR